MIRPPVPVTLLLVLLWGPIFGTCLRPPGPSLSGVNRNLQHKSDIGFWHRQLQAGHAGEGGEEGLPYNFSWIERARLAGTSIPSTVAQLEGLVREGVRAVTEMWQIIHHLTINKPTPP